MPSSSSASHGHSGGGDHTVMDFSSLLSRGYRPADLSRIVPKERPKDFLKKEHHHNHHHNHHHQHHDSIDKSKLNCDESGGVANNNTDEGDNEDVLAVMIGTTAGVSEDRFLEKLEREEKTNRLVYQLVSKTSVYRKHLLRDGDDDPEEDAAARLEWSTKLMGDDADLKSYAPKLKWVSPLASALSLAANIDNNAAASTVTIEELSEEENIDVDVDNKHSTERNTYGSKKQVESKEISKADGSASTKNTSEKKKNPFSSLFHQVELGDWESNIEWEGYKEPSHNKNANDSRTGNASTGITRPNSTSSSAVTSDNKNHPSNSTVEAIDAISLLQKRRNPFLENISFDKLVSWTGDPEEALEKARSEPLILEIGVAGRSIAKYVLPNHRPLPYAKSDPYQARLEFGNLKSKGATTKGAVRSTAELNRGTLHADKEEMALFVQSRQSKRRQMAKDKTDRVKDAMGTMSVLGGGQGRTITSSLMGPGGTERTGRPSRHVGASSHEFEYIEQLDMITNHTLVKNPSKIMSREYCRPKLPGTIVRTSLGWQFCIRYLGTSSSADKQKKPEANNSSSYQSMMMGTYAGAISKTKLRTEADLTPTEGNLILLEYCEERPPLQLTKAMASKIVTYYRGDKSRCPVSAGGGDRPTRRKRQTGNEASLAAEKAAADGTKGRSDNKVEKPPRLLGPNVETTITDWVGKAPKRSKDDRKNEKENYNILPEGVTEILHQKAHGPFIGEIEDGQSVTGLISNLFVAPLFKQEPDSTDFLMILGRNSGASIAGRSESLSVILRDLPSSMFTVGQTEPRTRVYAPNTQGEKNFTGPFLSYQIAKVLTRAEMNQGHGLDFEELGIRTFPKLGSNGMRQRIKHVALYDKNTQIWSAKKIGQDDYPGVDTLGKQLAPEGVVAWEVADAAKQRMNDVGIHQLYSGSHATLSVGVTMFYLAGQMNAAREIARKVKKVGEMSKSNKSVKSLQSQYYEFAASELELMSKSLRQRHDVAKFIYEELQLAPWHITGELTDVHIKGDGSGMMKLTGLGDPSGIGEGFSFLREADTKPSKTTGSTMGQTAEMKKITGTSDDLRKLTMRQMGQILKSYGMAQKQVDTLKRWDRVHVIRDLSTKAASDGIGGGLKRFARGEKMKLSEQKQIYRERIQVIWKRQIAALASDTGDGRAGGDDGDVPNEADEATAPAAAQQKKEAAGKEDSDSDFDNDEFADALEEEMMDQTEANQLVARVTGGEASLGQLRLATQDQAMSNDARDLAALKRQREEERVAKEGMSSRSPAQGPAAGVPLQNRKIVRKRITKTYPDGRSITTFKFVMSPHEVGQTIARLQREEYDTPRKSYVRPDYMPDEKQIGHSMFSDEDDFEFTVRGGRSTGTKRRGGGRRGRGGGGRGMSRKKDLQFGKLKTKVTKEQRIKKRKREEDEMEVYSSIQRRQGTSNRKERGSIRDRRPHVIFANKLESIRNTVEGRPSAGAFHKPVNRKLIPRYYEMISHPMDLATIKTKIEKYEYRTADSLLNDFELVKNNAAKFNGATSMLATEATAIYDTAKNMIDAIRPELSHLEHAVADQMSTQSKKKRTTNKKSAASSAAPGGEDGLLAGIDLNLDFELSDDSD